MATIQGVYSKALFLSASKEGQQEVEKVGKELREFQMAYDICPELRRALNSSLFDTEARTKLTKELSKAMGFSSLFKNFLVLLSKKGRIKNLEEITAAYEDLINSNMGRENAFVRTAVKLSTEQIANLSKILSAKTGKAINLQQEEDKSLLGGFVVTVAGQSFDTSLRKQLQRIESICKV